MASPQVPAARAPIWPNPTASVPNQLVSSAAADIRLPGQDPVTVSAAIGITKVGMNTTNAALSWLAKNATVMNAATITILLGCIVNDMQAREAAIRQRNTLWS